MPRSSSRKGKTGTPSDKAGRVGGLMERDPRTADIAGLALLLHCHARALAAGEWQEGWIGDAELRQRAALLLQRCTRRGWPVPPELAQLVEFLLCGDIDPWSGKSKANGSRSKAGRWLLAIHAESEIPAEPGAEAFPVDNISAVARAASVSRDTVRGWRTDPAYVDAVWTQRLCRAVLAASDGGAGDEQLGELMARYEAVIVPGRRDLSAGLKGA